MERSEIYHNEHIANQLQHSRNMTFSRQGCQASGSRTGFQDEVEPWECSLKELSTRGSQQNDKTISSTNMSFPDFGESFSTSSDAVSSLQTFTQQVEKTFDSSAENLFLQSKSTETVASPQPLEKSYRCDDCNKSFHNKTDLENHNKMHFVTDQPWKCEICGKLFSWRKSLEVHMRIHVTEKTFSCDLCGKFYFQSIQSQSADKTMNKCNECKMLQSNTGSESLPNKIDSNAGAGKPFESKVNQLNSINTHTNKEKETSERYQMQQGFSGNRGETFSCAVCGKSFVDPTLGDHTGAHGAGAKYLCKTCQMVLPQPNGVSQGNTQAQTQKVKPYSCQQCEKTFSHLSGLRYHKFTHTGQKPYKCDICDKSFCQRSRLQIHVRVHTGEEMPFKCEVCNKTFSRNVSLQIHARSHSGERPYKCSVCEKAFSMPKSLNSHLLIHTGSVKPFKCEACGKTFSQRSHLHEHMFAHTMGEKRFKCEICGKAFSRNFSLQSHKRVHTGEKPYRCTICGKAFSHNSGLQYHAHTHSGKKPYKCDICNKAYYQRSRLQAHVNMHMEANKANTANLQVSI